MHYDRHPNFFWYILLKFPRSNRKDFENLSLLRKFKILPSVFPPVCLDIYDSLDEVVTGLWAEADCEPYSAKIDPSPVESTKHNEAKDFLKLHYFSISQKSYSSIYLGKYKDMETWNIQMQFHKYYDTIVRILKLPTKLSYHKRRSEASDVCESRFYDKERGGW